MKYSVDIALTTIHIGRHHRVVTLGLNGQDPAEEYLNELEEKDARAFGKIQARLKFVADLDRYENKVAFRSLGEGLFEAKIKTPFAVRVYVFYDRKTLGEESMIIAAHGGGKSSQQKDIRTARKRQEQYTTALKEQDTTLTLIKAKNED